LVVQQIQYLVHYSVVNHRFLVTAKPASMALDTKKVFSSEKSNQHAVLPVLFSPDATSKSIGVNVPSASILHVDTEPSCKAGNAGGAPSGWNSLASVTTTILSSTIWKPIAEGKFLPSVLPLKVDVVPSVCSALNVPSSLTL